MIDKASKRNHRAPLPSKSDSEEEDDKLHEDDLVDQEQNYETSQEYEDKVEIILEPHGWGRVHSNQNFLSDGTIEKDTISDRPLSQASWQGQTRDAIKRRGKPQTREHVGKPSSQHQSLPSVDQNQVLIPQPRPTRDPNTRQAHPQPSFVQ